LGISELRTSLLNGGRGTRWTVSFDRAASTARRDPFNCPVNNLREIRLTGVEDSMNHFKCESRLMHSVSLFSLDRLGLACPATSGLWQHSVRAVTSCLGGAVQ
jgi:hypothetical protein